jgi:hypothetical protein
MDELLQVRDGRRRLERDRHWLPGKQPHEHCARVALHCHCSLEDCFLLLLAGRDAEFQG